MTVNYFNLNKFKKIINIGFFTSVGGLSKGNYSSLNCSKSSKDKKITINKNINIALQKLDISHKKLKLINQIHSNKVICVNNNNYNKKMSGDGLITSERKIALGVLTADCAPIFIFDVKQSTICCLHAGWKGALSNIIKIAIKKMKNKKIDTKNMVAIVGPCLNKKNFEVNKNFKLNFLKKNKLYIKFFRQKNKYKDIFDLRGLINYQLREMGVKNIYNINRDTYKNSHIFFSHRRSVHQKNKDTGRMINIISFKD